MAFLLQVMFASSSRFSMALPVTPVPLRSTSIRWFSVVPDTMLIPRFRRPSQSALAFFTMFFWYSLYSGCSASFKQTALVATTCISGPPWIPGNTALLKLNFFAISALHIIIPPLGPLSVLWVVVVVTCAYGMGLGCTPAATRPAIWAISTIR